MDPIQKISSLIPKHHDLRLRLTDAIIDLCRQEAFYVEELRIEGTVCVVSDRSSVLITQITEQIGHQLAGAGSSEKLPLLDKDQAANRKHNRNSIEETAGSKEDAAEDETPKTGNVNKKAANICKGRYQCPFCPKAYRFKPMLRDHMNVHMGRRSHVCRFCLRPFTHLGSMCRHMRRGHREQLSRPHVCHLSKQPLGSCCPCHVDSQYPAVSMHEPDSLQLRIATQGLCSTHTELDLPSRPMDVEGMTTFASNGLENLKQELVETEGRRAIMGDKEAEGILDMKNFLRQFETEKNDGGHHEGEAGNPVEMVGSLPCPQGDMVLGGNITPATTTADLIHTLSLSQVTAEPGSTNRWQNNPPPSVNHLSLQQVSLPPPTSSSTSASSTSSVSTSSSSSTTSSSSVQVPQTVAAGIATGLNRPTLEMLAHITQLGSPLATAFPSSSELSKAFTYQQHAVSSHLRMPSPHSLLRSADGMFQCPFCEKTYNFKHTLKDHINKHMGNRPHVCKHCGDSFTHLAILCAHIKQQHDSQMTSDYQCDLCREKFMNLQSLKQHFTWRHKDVKFSPQKFLESSCGVILEPCDGSGTGAPSLFLCNSPTHTSDSSPQVLSALTCLGPPLPNGALLPSLASSGPRLSNSAPVSEMRTPEELHLFQPEKNMTTSSNDRLLKAHHEASVTALNSQPQFPGDFVYPNLSGCHDNLRHLVEGSLLPLRQPSGEDIMSSVTTHIADYFTEVNLQTEQGLYKYKCRLCGNLFKIRNSLYEHLNSHLGKKPYVCGVCGNAFTHHSSLHNHTRNKHSHQSRQEREAAFRHSCQACAKKFRFPSELDRHFKTNPDHDLRQSPAV